jgi:hypothetical protein
MLLQSNTQDYIKLTVRKLSISLVTTFLNSIGQPVMLIMYFKMCDYGFQNVSLSTVRKYEIEK